MIKNDEPRSIDLENLAPGTELVVYWPDDGVDVNWIPNQNSEEFEKKYPYLNSLVGRSVKFLNFHNETEKGKLLLDVKLIDEDEIFWAHKDFFRQLSNTKAEVECKCNVFITGCICGVFQKEQAGKC